MNDKYPETLSIEIDRGRLRNYLRFKSLFAWALVFSVFGGLFGFASISSALEHGLPSRADAAFIVLRCIGAGIGVALILAMFCYLVFSHRFASRIAASLEVTVEGSFLHIRQHAAVLTDRKLHFRSIVDYTVTQDAFMRCFGIHALHMATTAGGQNARVVIPGVKDCLRVRDVLADIDQLREHR